MASRSTGMWGAACTASTATSAPAPCALFAIVATSLTVPTALEVEPYGYEPGPIVDLALDVVRFQGERLGVDPDPAHRGSSLGGGEEPGVHVRAVVELGHHDLGIPVPSARKRARYRERERGHVRPEGHLVRPRTEEVGHSLTGVAQDLLGLDARREGAVQVGSATAHVARHRVDG